MNKSLSLYIKILSLTAALTIAAQMSSQEPRYRLIDMGTFGGPQSQLNPGSGNDFGDFTRTLNRRGVVVGSADTDAPDPFSTFCFFDCNAGHTFWAGSTGHLHDLGALPGGGSSLPTWISDNGLIVGFSEYGDQTDPLYAGLPQLRAVLWQHGEINDLGTLRGGNQSEANAVNSSGQVVGASTTMVPDINSMQSGDFNLWGPLVPPYGYQLRAFIWDTENGMRELDPLPGGTNARALLINDRGQVVGHSYTAGSTQSPLCDYPLATDSFVWEKGKGMVDLGGLGGTCTLAFNLNQAGEIVGSSNLKEDKQSHAFLWKLGKIHDLGGSLGGGFTGADSINEAGEAVGFATLSDGSFHAALWRQVGDLTDLGVIENDLCSYATGINARGQVVGTSLSTCDADTGLTRAFLWEHGNIFDLNTLIPPDSTLHLLFVDTINDRGEIAGIGVDGITLDEHVFLLVPCGENEASDCRGNVSDQSNALIHANATNSTAKSLRIPQRMARLLRQMGAR